MLETVIVLALLVILACLFWPQPKSLSRKVTRSYNGRHYGAGQEQY